VKSQKRIHPVTLFVVIHVLALGLAIVAADLVAQAYADRASDHSSRMQLVPMPHPSGAPQSSINQ
jgi:hypothetical protein